eukprot:CAMPEP_0197540892 /NCGR_PEP_ID=MMETSP1318-20131121/66850_1 /TAXON_ID=552666 /ORGANISM="Partenskyella glossopodia, Strain RCC365" /LENGTH=261 /DNA_ID=CAMNT_0043100005 /DNA_START=1572 /DNA_END=2357 /DNA_ORIENTATION=+
MPHGRSEIRDSAVKQPVGSQAGLAGVAPSAGHAVERRPAKVTVTDEVFDNSVGSAGLQLPGHPRSVKNRPLGAQVSHPFLDLGHDRLHSGRGFVSSDINVTYFELLIGRVPQRHNPSRDIHRILHPEGGGPQQQPEPDYFRAERRCIGWTDRCFLYAIRELIISKPIIVYASTWAVLSASEGTTFATDHAAAGERDGDQRGADQQRDEVEGGKEVNHLFRSQLHGVAADLHQQAYDIKPKDRKPHIDVVAGPTDYDGKEDR